LSILSGLQVIDLSSQIAGPYATKLFADAGAEIVKVETEAGDPLRRRSISGNNEESVLFKYLNAGKQSVIGHVEDPHVIDLMAGADLVVEDFVPARLDVPLLRTRARHLVVTSITPYGRTGPWADRPATEFVVQAEAGSIAVRGQLEHPPVQAGGRLSEWIAGAYGAVASLAAVIRARKTDSGETIDVSWLEASNHSLIAHADITHVLRGRPPIDGPARTTETPSIERTADGLVGFMTMTRHHFESFLLLIERPDLIGDERWPMLSYRLEHLDEWQTMINAWMERHTTAEVLRLATELRIPVSPVNDGASLLEHEQMRARAIFTRSADGSFIHPLPPYRFDGHRLGGARPAPALGQHSATVSPLPRSKPVRPGLESTTLPLEGVRILDATTYWAGPSGPQLLAVLGADVIHLESTRHLDGGRLTSAYLAHLPDWWERGQLFLTVNNDKRGLTIDLSRDEGRAVLRRLLRHVDIMVENFSPRVFDGFRIDEAFVHTANPATTFVRMPAFGLDGPWRENIGFAQTMEQLTGLAWITGYRDQPPLIVRGICDPLAGVHAAFAMLVALVGRDRDGRGRFVEVAMAETAINVAAEQVAEYSAHGTVLERDGNRGPDAAPQGLYGCCGEERWIAIAVTDDSQWQGLCRALGQPTWANRPEYQSSAGRRAAHDLIDARVSDWAGSQDLDAAVDLLVSHGVPAGAVRDPRRFDDHPQLVARGFIEEVEHPIAGRHPLAFIPFRYGSVKRWTHQPAPLLGEHNHEVLSQIAGLSDDEICRLEDDGVIGNWPANLPPRGRG
jgi:crotonobetainyl-CoA:carnitine CoA-transferase CaiB-like acyl-CoA transferase